MLPNLWNPSTKTRANNSRARSLSWSNGRDGKKRALVISHLILTTQNNFHGRAKCGSWSREDRFETARWLIRFWQHVCGNTFFSQTARSGETSCEGECFSLVTTLRMVVKTTVPPIRNSPLRVGGLFFPQKMLLNARRRVVTA